MGITLPGEVAWVLDLLGVEWPDIDEDELRSIADDLRSLAEEMRGDTGDAQADIAEMLGVNSLESLKLFEALWSKLAEGHLDQLAQGFDLLALGLDVAAVVVVGLKLAAIVQLVTLAAQIPITRTIVKQLIEQAVQSVQQQLVDAITGPVFAALESAGTELAGQLLGTALGTRDGVDLGEVAAAGRDGLESGARQSAENLRNLPQNTLNDAVAGVGPTVTAPRGGAGR